MKRILHGAAAAIALLAISPGAIAENLSNAEVGYSLGLAKSYQAVANSNGPELSALEFVFKDYYQLDNAICQEALTPKEFPFPFKRRCSTFYFPSRTAADIARMKAESEKKDEAGKATFEFYLDLDRVYQSFEEYAKDKIQGFYFAEEKPGKFSGYDCVVREMVFEKLTSVPQRWIACSYKVPGGEFAVLFTCTEQHFKKCRPEFNKAFSSLKFTDAAGPKAKPTSKSLAIEVDKNSLSREDYLKLPLAERLAYLEKKKNAAFEKARSTLPKGWGSYETKHFLVCHDDDKEFAREASRHAEAVLDWLNDRFASLESVTPQSMILVSNSKPANGISIGISGSISFGVGEVQTVNARRSYNGRPDMSGLSTDVLDGWFSEKNDGLYRRLPNWFRYGLVGLVSSADSKRGKLSFDEQEDEKETLTEAMKADKEHKGPPESAPLIPVKQLMLTSGREMFEGQNAKFSVAQATSVIRYLLEGPGSKNDKTRSALQHYVANLSEQVAEVEARLEAERKLDAAEKSTAKTLSDEERLKAEDEAYKKKRDNEYSKIEKELANKTFERTFKGMDDKAWEQLDASWRSYAKSRLKN